MALIPVSAHRFISEMCEHTLLSDSFKEFVPGFFNLLGANYINQLHRALKNHKVRGTRDTVPATGMPELTAATDRWTRWTRCYEPIAYSKWIRNQNWDKCHVRYQ